MKNLCISFLGCFIIILSVVGLSLPKAPVYTEYLRIHIRANSNGQDDQRVKYLVKEKLVEFLTPVLAECKTKERATEKLLLLEGQIEKISNEVLFEQGFSYKSDAEIREELFPTRTYNDFTLESGYYDALIVELGSGEGDNWWCVVYPPLCFVNQNAGYVYKSKLMEIINQFISKMEGK